MDQYDVSSASAVVEVKTSVAGVRDVRAALARLASLLGSGERRRAYLLLVEPKVATSTLAEELEIFRRALKRDVAERLYLVTAEAGDTMTLPQEPPLEDRELLRRALGEIQEEARTLPRPDMQSEVTRYLLLQWFMRAGPLSPGRVQDAVGCAYRTVIRAVERLGRVVERTSDGSILLSAFPIDAWPGIVAESSGARSTHLYSDASGQPRSPESLLRRLEHLGRSDVAVGGVLGAARVLPELDIVGTPRLDITVHGPTRNPDVEIARSLDPGLVLTDAHTRPPTLAVHFLRRQESLFERDHNQNVAWADPIECLLDLYEARLDAQARQFLQHIAESGGGEGW